jgi:hypothetical protein
MLLFPGHVRMQKCADFGDQLMRLLAVMALAMLLAGCEGDRIKQSKNAPIIVAGRHEAVETLASE